MWNISLAARIFPGMLIWKTLLLDWIPFYILSEKKPYEK
tara:strand:- start:1028 stop:1144 length:117 start_codon:yes stop_codon:yes gene_type:complete